MGTEADIIKQSCWAEAEAAKAGKIISATELPGNHRNRMYCLSKGWFPYDRRSQIAIRSAIVCDHMETTSAIVCDPAIVIADDRRR